MTLRGKRSDARGAAKIFICYRRDDSGPYAGRIHGDLGKRFENHEVFMDLGIELGAAFDEKIESELSACAAVLVLIGPAWLNAADEHGGRRLDDPEDFVRREIAIALQRDAVLVIPLLVRRAAMPTERDLPAPLAGLARRRGLELRDDRWRDDIRLVEERLVRHLSELPGNRLTAVPAAPHEPGNYRRRLRPLALGVLAVVALAAAIIALKSSGPVEPTLRIYSSLPEFELHEPASVATNGSSQNLSVVKNQRTTDMENGARLALQQAGGKAGKFNVTYQALDDAGPNGDSPNSLVQTNATRAANDEHTAAYIGDFTSGATQQSIPILSQAKVPQISPAATRVGLTNPDPRGDVDEPPRYYPTGYRNFVRIIPSGAVHAKAQLALMTKTYKCKRVAMINDGSPYGQALANNIRNYNRIPRWIVFSQVVGPYQHYDDLVNRVLAMKRKGKPPDCFVYSGTRNPNTVEIFNMFAAALPNATLFGTNGVASASFYDPHQGGLKDGSRVIVMVPPRDNRRTQPFIDAFRNQGYGKDPDPYAVYAYEAMRLALNAIQRSITGTREDVRTALFNTADRRDSLGTYSITSSGDTTLQGYDWSNIIHGTLTPPRPAPRRIGP